MLKINSRTLAEFVSKVTINGKITDGILKFGSEGLTLTVKDLTNNGASSGLLRRSNFSEYEEMNVAIKNTSNLIKILNLMNGNIELSIRGSNVFHISSDTIESDIIIPDETYLECNLDALPMLAHDGGFDIESTVFEKVIKTTQILNTSKVGVIAEVKDHVLYILTGEDNFDKLVVKCPADYKDVKCRYGSIFLEFIPIIKGKVNISFNKDYPILITYKDSDSVIRWMISPIVPENEEAEEQ